MSKLMRVTLPFCVLTAGAAPASGQELVAVAKRAAEEGLCAGQRRCILNP